MTNLPSRIPKPIVNLSSPIHLGTPSIKFYTSSFPHRCCCRAGLKEFGFEGEVLKSRMRELFSNLSIWNVKYAGVEILRSGHEGGRWQRTAFIVRSELYWSVRWITDGIHHAWSANWIMRGRTGLTTIILETIPFLHAYVNSRNGIWDE